MNYKIIPILLIFALFVSVTVSIADAAHATPPPPGSTPVPAGGGGGGGGGYTPPAATADVFPKIFHITNSNGVIIGNVTANSYSDIQAHAEWNVSTDNGTEWVYVDATFGSIPTSDVRMDISLVTPDSSLLPDFLHPDRILAQVNLSKCSGWNIKDGSFKITVKVPKTILEGIGANDSYYIVQTDANSVLKANLAGPDKYDLMSYDGTSYHVSLSSTDTRQFILLANSNTMPTPVPKATPLPTATPTPTPSGGSGISTFVLLLMVFIPAVIAGLIIVYYEMLRKGK